MATAKKKTEFQPCGFGCGKRFGSDETLAAHHIEHRKAWMLQTFSPENLQALAGTPAMLTGILKKHMR